MSQQFNCDHLRCKKPATWHGFDGRSHFCEVHRPDAPSERVYVPGRAWDWSSAPGFDKNKNRKRR